jgi:hypothetical protein
VKLLPSRSRRLALLACLSSLAAPAVAGESLGHVADLSFGPVLGGLPARLDLRTTLPGAPFALFLGGAGGPTPVGPKLLPLDVNLALPFVLVFGVTDGAGRFAATLPTAPGQFGAAGTGLAIHVQAVVLGSANHKLASNVETSEIEPLPASPGYLVEDGLSSLPAGSDQLGGIAAEAADIDHDGHADLLIATDFDVRIWHNDGAGQFADETAARITWPGDSLTTLRAADVDLDGDVDLLTAGGYDDFVSLPDRLWLNDAAGHFAASATFPEGIGLTTRLEVADVNGDGWPDVLAANAAENQLAVPGGTDRLLLGLGDAQFQESAAFAAAAWNDPLTRTNAIRAGDVDGDGDLDLFVAASDTAGVDGFLGQPNLLLQNDGAGGFTDVSATHLLPTLSDNSQDAAFVDLDGDLDLDIVVANSLFGVAPVDSGDVYWNQGGKQGGPPGVFHDDPASFLEPWTDADGIRLSVLTDDLDSDGDADVIVTVHDLFIGADQMLFLNSGGAQGGTEGVLVRQPWFDAPGSGTSGLGDFVCFDAAAFDADHDGDHDLILFGDGVVTADPMFALVTRFLRNTKL